MTSVIRVKRKRISEPAEALLLARKKLRNDWDNEPTKSDMADVIKIEEKVFHFAGTVDAEVAYSQDVVIDKVKEAVMQRRQQKENMKAMSRKRKIPRFMSETYSHLPKIKQLRDNTIAICQSVIKDNCLSCSSHTKVQLNSKDSSIMKIPTKVANPQENGAKKSSKFTSAHYDEEEQMNLKNHKRSEDSIMCNNIKMLREKLTISDTRESKQYEFVYDLYYSRDNSTNWDMGDLLYVQPYRYNEEELLCESSSEDEYYEDEDDSNDEDNWRNDYPCDEDSSGSSSSSEDEWERFIQQEEEDMEQDDDLDGAGGDDLNDDSKYREEDREEFDYHNELEEEVAFGGYDDHNNDPNNENET